MKKLCTTLLFLCCFVAVRAEEDDTTKIQLVRIYPEPFHEVLTFEFIVKDDVMHPVQIHIMNTRDELVFFESVLVYKNHEKITINTIDFFDTGMYSIKVEMDRKYKILKKFKRY